MRRGSGRSKAASSTSRPYVPNGTIGDAVISADTDTKQITVIADEETARYIRQVIHGLDRPKPQVLIKVVFLEVSYNNASDIGIEGTITGKIKGPHHRDRIQHIRAGGGGGLARAAGRRSLHNPRERLSSNLASHCASRQDGGVVAPVHSDPQQPAGHHQSRSTGSDHHAAHASTRKTTRSTHSTIRLSGSVCR